MSKLGGSSKSKLNPKRSDSNKFIFKRMLNVGDYYGRELDLDKKCKKAKIDCNARLEVAVLTKEIFNKI